MKKRRPKIIKDKKERGEWAESVFTARAAENGLPVSKPMGDSRSFDCVVGRPGKFVTVQVKCTVAELRNGRGYNCSVCSSHKAYRAGAFDFLAAYVVLEDLWYIIPAKLIRGLMSISLCTTGSEAKYEEYREAWQLLRKASECIRTPLRRDRLFPLFPRTFTRKVRPPQLLHKAAPVFYCSFARTEAQC